MADSDITHLPDLVGPPAVGDNLVIDDISEGVSTRTKRVEVKNFFDDYMVNNEIPEGKFAILRSSDILVFDEANGGVMFAQTITANTLLKAAIINETTVNGDIVIETIGTGTILMTDLSVNEIKEKTTNANLSLTTVGTGVVSIGGVPFKNNHIVGTLKVLFRTVAVDLPQFHADMATQNLPSTSVPVPITGTLKVGTGATYDHYDMSHVTFDGSDFTFFGSLKGTLANGNWDSSSSIATFILVDTPSAADFTYSLCIL